MALVDKFERNIDLGITSGKVPVSWRYTLGVGGEKFFRALMDKGQVLASYCPRCEQWFLPPSIFCEKCFSRMDKFKDVGTTAEVKSYTVAHYGLDGNKLKEPVVYALLSWPEVEGGFIQKLEDVKPEEVAIGMPVKAKIKKGAKKFTAADVSFKPIRKK